MSCIQPMFHFLPKPRPPASTGALTPENAVDSSAIMCTPGCTRYTVAFTSRRKSIASRLWLPPCTFGSH